MNISILCSSKAHPIYASLERWVSGRIGQDDVTIVNEVGEIVGGDILFLISCGEIVHLDVRAKFKHSLVVHASVLPAGRGWSPHIWQILDGQNIIPVTLLEAENAVDSGKIWTRIDMHLEGHELYDEINSKLEVVILKLLDFAVENIDSVKPHPQTGANQYYRRRSPEDSRLDPFKTIAEQFELLRVADPNRFPCFIEYRGQKYVLTIRKMKTS